MFVHRHHRMLSVLATSTFSRSELTTQANGKVIAGQVIRPDQEIEHAVQLNPLREDCRQADPEQAEIGIDAVAQDLEAGKALCRI
jgi:hypothetical protein